MRTLKTIGLTSERALAGCGAAAVLTLAGTVPGTFVPAAHAATGATVAAVRPARPAAYTQWQGTLLSLAAVSASDAWAVGPSHVNGSLVMHWNGTRWSRFLNPAGYLSGVAARSATDVWAVGDGSPSPGLYGQRTLVMHWNGRSWTKVPTPTPSSGGSFNAVAATSSGDAWAVGQAGPKLGSSVPVAPLIEQWNGRKWTLQRTPSLPGGGRLSSVSAVSASDAWAVGSTGPQTGAQTLAEHWNGHAWSRMGSPNLAGASSSAFNSVIVISANNAWAVGSATLPGGGSSTLTAFWNGRHWRLVASPNPGLNPKLQGVTASWTHNIWAVGTTWVVGCDQHCWTFDSLIMHWNGVRWKVMPSPTVPGVHAYTLYCVAAAARDDIWAAGSAQETSTLIIHWNGLTWS
jgi:hypothetical protein